MARTTFNQVAAIIEIDTTVTADAAPFIEIATALVDAVVAIKTNSDGSAYHTSEQLELIERWLAAHFYTVRDARTTSESAGPVSASFQSKVDLGLATSHYGQTAMLMDTSGALAAHNANSINANKKRTAKVTWLGTATESVITGIE